MIGRTSSVGTVGRLQSDRYRGTYSSDPIEARVMKLPIVRRGSTGFWQAMTVATAIALWPPDSIDAAVAEIALSDLAKGSDIIIVARVVKVENGPAELKSTD